MATLLLLAFCLTLFGVWSHRVVVARERLKLEQWQMQSIRLAEAGLKRAAILYAANPDFKQETWKVLPDLLDKQHSAEIKINLAPGSSKEFLRLQAIAEFPAGEVHRAHTTRSIEIPTPPRQTKL